ncbi:MAG: putative porin [Elusimicrobia bacterium]|nr:putative porin [Elusimicrobiota bacterium]
MEKLGKMFSIAVCMMLLAVSSSFCGEIDILVKKLMKKGVLEPGEAQQILTETNEQQRKQLAKGELDGLPGWVQKLELKGDFRLRHQWDDEITYERVRYRLRFRLKGEAEVTKGVKTSFGLCTGGTDPRSTNQTLENSFETKGIWLDYAYVDYAAGKMVSLAGGKIPIGTVIWIPSDLLWDGDITLEGGLVKISNNDFYINTAALIIDEIKTESNDPMLYLIQPVVNIKVGDIGLKLAAAYYNFAGVKKNSLDHTRGTNTTVSGNLKYDYDSLGAGMELSTGKLYFPKVAVFGEGISTFDPDDGNIGYLAGLKFGDSKISSAGQWEFKGMFRTLERDSWLDIFPDSDSYGGDTAVQGFEVVWTYGLGKNMTLGFDYYNMKKLKTGDNEQKKLLQSDLVFKF